MSFVHSCGGIVTGLLGSCSSLLAACVPCRPPPAVLLQVWEALAVEEEKEYCDVRIALWKEGCMSLKESSAWHSLIEVTMLPTAQTENTVPALMAPGEAHPPACLCLACPALRRATAEGEPRSSGTAAPP